MGSTQNVAKQAEPAVKTCSKPGCTRPRSSEDSTNPWCKQCWAEYIGGYKLKAMRRAQLTGFQQGIVEMRMGVYRRLRSFGTAVLTAAEVAEMVRTMDTTGLVAGYEEALAKKP